MNEPILSIGDRKFVVKLMRIFNVKRLNIDWSNSKKKYPDIWVELGKIPEITITEEWKNQDKDERRKRLTHEFLHIIGYSHNEENGYSTHPDNDVFSRRIYEKIK